jgi:hypothetical protein
MPDLKFRNGKFFFFSILSNTPSGITPLLIPVISNPDFIDPVTYGIKGSIGIKELLEGDLGITERIMMPILDPILSMATQAPHVAKTLVEANKPLEEVNPDVVKQEDSQEKIAAQAKAIMLKSYIPQDAGLKSLEKTIITTMMESHKPVFDFAKILIEMLGIAEDVVCRFLGTSIKILGKQVGFPSRNPKFWNESLGYAKTMTFSQADFNKAFSTASKAFIDNISKSHPLKGKNDDLLSEKEYGGDDRDALYIGYFDAEGNEVTPPAWVLNSNKWFEKEVLDSAGNTVKLSSPFKRLSSDLDTGVEQIRGYHVSAIEKMERSKADILEQLDLQLTKTKDAAEIENLNNQKKATVEEFSNLIQSMFDMLDGTNISGGNFVDDEDKTKGVNEPAILTEWVSKTRGAQLRQKYFPETVSTTQSLVDEDGEPKAPYVFIPKATINYRGRNVQVEMPLAYEKQVKQEEVKSSELFYDKRKKRIGKDYSMRNVVKNHDIYFNTNPEKPYNNDKVTYFSHSGENSYLPDALKNFYLPVEWEEVFEYEIRNSVTGEVVSKEREAMPYKIDIENDYEVRVIKVVNRSLPLVKNPLLDKKPSKSMVVDPLTGTVLNKGNNIPEALVQDETGATPASNLHSTPDINEANDLKEGIIYHGLDPRFPEQKVFFLVEALKKDSRGIAAINKKFNDKDLKRVEEEKNTGGKMWYGLLDKFTAIPMIAMKLLPLIGGKLIPLIVKIIQLVSNPTKIKTMLTDLISDETISKFAKHFPAFSKKGSMGKVGEIVKSGKKPPKSLDEPEIAPKDKMYYAGAQLNTKDPKIISMIDGEAVAEFGKGAFKKPLFTFGIEVDAANYLMPFKPITKRTEPTPPINPELTPEEKAKLEKKAERGKQTQAMITLILNFIKMPFEIIFMIFQWVMKWVKKLLNPIKIPAAITEFVSFKWLLDIIGQKGLFAILGMVEPDKAQVDKISEAASKGELVDKVIDSLKKGDEGMVEVLVYHIFKNGIQVDEEVVERPYNSENKENSSNRTAVASGTNTGVGTGTGTGTGNDADAAGSESKGFNPLAFCGERTFNINDILPIPFFAPMPTYNMCEMPILFLKPLEQIGGLLHLIQELLNALIAMPMSIFGLDPHIKVPKLTFYDAYQSLLDAIMAKAQQTT